ncbi:MAG: hypothetical protein K0S58_40 [Nitrospira sp.]|jgi:hypothetical protein|nr:hypothetical protein [Nitrospira sp.]
MGSVLQPPVGVHEARQPGLSGRLLGRLHIEGLLLGKTGRGPERE